MVFVKFERRFKVTKVRIFFCWINVFIYLTNSIFYSPQYLLNFKKPKLQRLNFGIEILWRRRGTNSRSKCRVSHCLYMFFYIYNDGGLEKGTRWAGWKTRCRKKRWGEGAKELIANVLNSKMFVLRQNLSTLGHIHLQITGGKEIPTTPLQNSYTATCIINITIRVFKLKLL